MPPFALLQGKRGRGAERPVESPPAGTSEHNGNQRSEFSDMSVQGRKAQFYPRSAARNKGYQQLQQGQHSPPVAGHLPGLQHPAAHTFNAVNQEQLLAAYVAMMQSPSGSPYAAQQFQHVLGGITNLPAAAIDWNGFLSRQGSVATSGRWDFEQLVLHLRNRPSENCCVAAVLHFPSQIGGSQQCGRHCR